MEKVGVRMTGQHRHITRRRHLGRRILGVTVLTALMGLTGVQLGHLNLLKARGQTSSVVSSAETTVPASTHAQGDPSVRSALIPSPGTEMGNQTHSSAGTTGTARSTSGTSSGRTHSVVHSVTEVPLPVSVMLKVPPQDQLPEYKNGCEVTSLSMLLTAVGHPVSKEVLAQQMPKDPTPLVLGPHATVKSWGNPNVGFVGNISNFGYGIYHGPLSKLLNQILPGRAEDLTGKPFAADLAAVASGRPVVLWTTANFKPTQDWVTWQSPEGPVHATWEEHAILLVGYDASHLYVNNPLTGQAAQPVNRDDFLAAWRQLGEQALTVTPVSDSQGSQGVGGGN